MTAKAYSGSVISPPKRGMHFLHLDDFSKDELQNMLDLAKLAKSKFYASECAFRSSGSQMYG